MIAIAVSGGIDSLVSAWLLKNQGHQLMALHFLTGYETKSCILAQEELKRILLKLDIPLIIVDLHHVFQDNIVHYFVKSYLTSQTPNPCLMCNAQIKFGELLKHAKELGADKLATGHYARIHKDSAGYHLLKGKDIQKDQSYFLSMLTQSQLHQAIFPLAHMTKNEVNLLASTHNLTPPVHKESQEICFIHHDNYKEFLIQNNYVISRPGPIKTTFGDIIGYHQGLHEFTIGQRKGINCPAAHPYYVISLNQKENTLIVGQKEELMANECNVENINWIQPAPTQSIECKVRVRYRSKEETATVVPEGNHRATVFFHKPQMAITPGQGAVFYFNQEIIGGGWITD